MSTKGKPTKVPLIPPGAGYPRNVTRDDFQNPGFPSLVMRVETREPQQQVDIAGSEPVFKGNISTPKKEQKTFQDASGKEKRKVVERITNAEIPLFQYEEQRKERVKSSSSHSGQTQPTGVGDVHRHIRRLFADFKHNTLPEGEYLVTVPNSEGEMTTMQECLSRMGIINKD